MGTRINTSKNTILISYSKNLKKINISTKPYPGFPTDLQAQFMVLMTQANGISKIKENIFENRFMHVPELRRMGAKIEIKNKVAHISGPTNLTGAEKRMLQGTQISKWTHIALVHDTDENDGVDEGTFYWYFNGIQQNKLNFNHSIFLFWSFWSPINTY